MSKSGYIAFLPTDERYLGSTSTGNESKRSASDREKIVDLTFKMSSTHLCESKQEIGDYIKTLTTKHQPKSREKKAWTNCYSQRTLRNTNILRLPNE